MTILQTCCCCTSVRQGSIACGVYTGIYYSINAVHSSYLLHEEIRLLKNTTRSSIMDQDLTSGTSAVFSSLIFAFSSCGLVSTILLFYGIYKDIKYLLIPWIFNMVFFTIVDIIYVIHGLVVHALQWNPSVAIIITVDFFLNALNVYALLCVVSQYEEYKAGRGKEIAPNHQFSTTQPTGTSGYLNPNHKQPRMYFNGDTPNNHSPSELGTNKNYLRPPSLGRPRKCVKFGDNLPIENGKWEEVKQHHSPCRGVDTAPLIPDSGGTIEHAS